MARSPFALLALLPTGCALLSGLSEIGVGNLEAGADASSEVKMSDAGLDSRTNTDVLVTSDARAGTAIELSTTCATAMVPSDLLSFSDKDFTVSFWFKPGMIADMVGLNPIVWKGGRAGGENGWMVGIQKGGLAFCAADSNGGGCAMANQPLPVGHLVHVAAASKANLNQFPRALQIYALDLSIGEKMHTLVASGTAPNNWN